MGAEASSNLHFEKALYDSIPGVLLGALIGGGASALIGNHSTGPEQYTRKLKFEPEAFDVDSTCASLFLKLQQYRVLAPEEFDKAGDEADKIFCLEKQLIRNEITWEPGHPLSATGYEREMNRRLQNLLTTARDKLYSDKVQQYEQAQKQQTSNPQTAQLLQNIKHGREIVSKMQNLTWQIRDRIEQHIKKIHGGFGHSLPPAAR